MADKGELQKKSLFPQALDFVYSGYIPGENSSDWFHGEPDTHLHCSTGECSIASSWNHTELWLKVMLRNPLVLALAPT